VLGRVEVQVSNPGPEAAHTDAAHTEETA
jgi:hypothetical protein